MVFIAGLSQTGQFLLFAFSLSAIHLLSQLAKMRRLALRDPQSQQLLMVADLSRIQGVIDDEVDEVVDEWHVQVTANEEFERELSGNIDTEASKLAVRVEGLKESVVAAMAAMSEVDSLSSVQDQELASIASRVADLSDDILGSQQSAARLAGLRQQMDGVVDDTHALRASVRNVHATLIDEDGI
jgi:predicted  nucleic acid-binding Zn-ribbon protein